MNYRHHYHAGNFADAMKHVFLVAVLRALQAKPKGLLLLDTHAGRGEYDLEAAASGQTLPRRPEHPDGIGRLAAEPPPGGLDDSAGAAAIADYLSLVRAFSPELRRYPGSPRLLQMLARPQDRIVLCELHPEEAEDLRLVMGRAPQVSVQPVDGYTHLRAVLPPPERRALVLIDPPFESPDEWNRVRAALAEGVARLPGGTFMVWHPLTARAGADSFWDEIAASDGPPAWAGRLLARPEAEGFRGCGLIVLNPPFRFAPHADAILKELGARLCPNGANDVASRWLRPDV